MTKVKTRAFAVVIDEEGHSVLTWRRGGLNVYSIRSHAEREAEIQNFEYAKYRIPNHARVCLVEIKEVEES